MTCKIFLVSLLISSSSLVFAGDPKFPVNTISEDLKKDANAVIRNDQTTYRIISKRKAKVSRTYAVTIFNDKAKGFASETLHYNKLTKIVDFNAYVYDASGNLLKKLKSKEIQDQSAYDGFSLYSDLRLKHVNLTQSTYPYTVEFEYEKEYDYLYGIDEPDIIPAENIALQRCTYQIIFPSELEPRYKTVNLAVKPTLTKTSDGLMSLDWLIENIRPIKTEPLGPELSKLAPQILIAPTQFEYSGYAGNMSTWADYGKWQLSLNKGRDVLSESTKKKIQELTKGLASTEEKSKVLYEYLQSKTRYVNIALGIGGLQPFEASVVDQVGYGDCKALSNYMVAMLKEAGIKAYYTKIMAGADAPEIQTDFPSHQTNHIIVSIPNEKDTIWLECTSQINPFGYLGKFTSDRKAIMITEKGGVIVKTPAYPGDMNIQSRTANVEIDINGNATAKVKTTYSGLQYEEENLDEYLARQFEDQKKWVLENTNIPSFDVKSFTMANKRDKMPCATVNLQLTLNRYATVSGKRLFLTPNLMSKSSYIPERVDTRTTSVIRKLAYTDIDSIHYKLPENIYPEFLPAPVKLKNQFGEYEATFKIEEGNLLYIRKVKMNKGEFPAASYQELIDFFKTINKADNTKLVFISKT